MGLLHSGYLPSNSASPTLISVKIVFSDTPPYFLDLDVPTLGAEEFTAPSTRRACKQCGGGELGIGITAVAIICPNRLPSGKGGAVLKVLDMVP